MSGNLGLIRIDKIGDLVNTLPVDQAQALTGKNIFWAINKGLGEVVEHAIPRRQFTEIASLAEFRDWIRKSKIDQAIVFYGPWWVYWGLWLERVPVRIGRLSKWYSFVLLNRGLRQKRSRSEKHEADYNMELIQYGLGSSPENPPPLKIKPPLQRHLLEKHGLQSQGYVVVHPGMAGSAKNWSSENYIKTIEQLVKKNTVVITGTPSDEESLKEIAARFRNHSEVRWLQNQLSLSNLLYILSQAQAVVVPSTGVAHLAASLGVKVVSLYPDNILESPKRWGARGDQVVILDLEKATVESVLNECWR